MFALLRRALIRYATPTLLFKNIGITNFGVSIRFKIGNIYKLKF